MSSKLKAFAALFVVALFAAGQASLSISSLSPSSAPVGSPATPLTIAGQNFAANSTILWTTVNGTQVALSPGLIQAAQIAATIPAALLATAGTAEVAVANPAGVLSNQLPFIITPPALQIPGGGGASVVTLPGGTVGVAYSVNLPVTGGTPPYNWTLLGGALPPGLSLSSSGTLSGVPSQPGGALFTAKVTAGSASASSQFLISISPQALTITTVSPLPNGLDGSPYPGQILTATGGNPPYAFQISGSLPQGLSLINGTLSGTPTQSGTFSFSVNVSDSSTPQRTGSTQFQLNVNPAGTDLLLGQGAVSFSLTNSATGLPTGARVSVESNTPTQILHYSFSVSPSVPWLTISGGGTTPGALNISLNSRALSLSQGVATTSVVVTCIAPSPCAGNTQKISVSVNVTTAAPQFSVTSSVVSFITSPGQAVSQTIGLQNVGGGSISISSVTSATNDIAISGVPSSLAAGPAVPITLTLTPAGLGAGFYQSSLSFITSVGPVTIPVTILISTSPVMTLSPGGAQFLMLQGGAPGNPAGSFEVSVTGSSPVNWSASVLPGASWLTLSTTSGTSTAANPGTVNFTINSTAASLQPQAYYAAIQVTSGNVVESPQVFIVVLNVEPGTFSVIPTPQPAGLLFIASSTTPPSQTVEVYANSVASQPYQASSDSSWLTVSPTTGTTSNASPATSTISVNLSGLAAGAYTGGVSYAFGGVAVRTVNVTLIVESGAVSQDRTPGTALPRASCVPAHLVPTQTGLVNTFAQPTAWPTPLTILLVNDCGAPVTNALVVAAFSNGDPPLALIPADTSTGTYSGTWTPRATAQQVTIVTTASATGFPTATMQISGQVTPNVAPILNQNGTLDAFAIAAEPGVPVSPGAIVQIYGSNLAAQPTPASTIPLPFSLNQTSVFIGGLQAPLYFVSPGQINAQIPFELPAGKPYQVIVNANGELSSPNTIQLSPDAPGIAQFAAGQIIAQHPDGSLVLETSPAAPNEYLVMYVAGMGLTNQTVASGTASPSTTLASALDNVTLTLNGTPVTNIIYAGLTPTLVGLYQVNFQVPANVPNGDLVLMMTQTSGVSNSTILPVHN
jgi:uncharacterized protein (TIGR03437 family)